MNPNNPSKPIAKYPLSGYRPTGVTKDEFLTNLSEFLGLPLDDASFGVLLDEGTWDSLAVLSIMGLAEEEWGLLLTADQLAECRTVGEVLQLVEPHFEG